MKKLKTSMSLSQMSIDFLDSQALETGLSKSSVLDLMIRAAIKKHKEKEAEEKAKQQRQS